MTPSLVERHVVIFTAEAWGMLQWFLGGTRAHRFPCRSLSPNDRPRGTSGEDETLGHHNVHYFRVARTSQGRAVAEQFEHGEEASAQRVR